MNSSNKHLGIIAIAALFGFVALLVAYAILNFAGFASCVIGAIVAIITAIVLWLGWRDAAEGPTGPRDLSPNTADLNTSRIATPSTTLASAPTAAAATPAAFASTGATPATPAAVKAAPASAKPAAKKATAVKAATPDVQVAKPAAVKPAKPAAVKAAKPAAAKPAAVKAAKPVAKAVSVKAAPAKAVKPAAKAVSVKAAPVAADGKPETLTKARAGGADDLKQLKGVGPSLEKTLNEMGFYHFDQVASWRKKEVEWVDSRLKFKGRIVRDEWIKQAKVLARGGTSDFSNKVKKGGVY